MGDGRKGLLPFQFPFPLDCEKPLLFPVLPTCRAPLLAPLLLA